MNPDAPAESRGSFFARKSTNRRKSTVGLVGLAVTIGVAGLGRWLLASSAEAHKTRPMAVLPVSVRVQPLAEETVASGIRYSGMVKELQRVDLSFRVAGTVSYLHQETSPGGRMRDVHEGDVLPRGTVIARLDPDDYGRERGQAVERLATSRARLLQAKSNTEQALLDYRRTEHLAQRNSISVSDLDNARTRLAGMRAAEAAADGDVASAAIGLEQAEANLRYCELAVPFDRSTVASREVDNNERVDPRQKMFTIVDLSSMVIAFNVADTLVGPLAIGQAVEVATDAMPGRRFTGVIHKIASTADSRTRTYPIEVRVDQPDGLRPGMVATVVFRDEVRAYLLPLTAVVQRTGGTGLIVYRVEDEAGQPVVRSVAIRFDDVLDNKVAVRMGDPGGLGAGDRVVATGVHRLRDGQSVKVAE